MANLPEKSPGSRLFALLQGSADALGSFGGWLAAGCLVGLTGLILAEIAVALVARVIPSMPSGIGIGWEYSAYLMGASFLLGSGMTLRAGMQLRVEILLRAGQRRFAAALEIASAFLGSAICLFLVIGLARMSLRTFGYGEVSQDSFTPLWIPQAVLTLGAAILALQMIARLFAALLGLALERPEIGAATSIE